MSFKISDNIIGFEEELSFFYKLYTKKCLPNTILFQGLEGIGKYTFVLHLINSIKSCQNTVNVELVTFTMLFLQCTFGLLTNKLE